MPRNSGSNGVHHTTKQKGKSLQNKSRGTYSLQNKSRHADRYPTYDKPAVDGEIERREGRRYRQEESSGHDQAAA